MNWFGNSAASTNVSITVICEPQLYSDEKSGVVVTLTVRRVLRAYRLEGVTANQCVDPLTLDDDCKAIICTLLSDMVQD